MADRLTLPYGPARKVTLVTAIEDADTNGELISGPERTDGTRRARQRLGEDPNAVQIATAVEERAEELLGHAIGREPLLERLSKEVPLSALFAIALLVPILYGVGRSALGPEKEIDIFANPLVILVVWNFVVSVIGILFAFFRRTGRRQNAAEGPMIRSERTSWLATRLGEWLLLFGVSGRALRRADRATLLGNVAYGFVKRWRSIAAPRHAATAQLLLHTIALLLLTTAVGEAYLRGLFTEYSVVWESTWLGAEAAGSLAQFLFEIPSRILGTTLELPEMREGFERDSAGPWIHRFAIAALIYAALPRLILLLVTVRRLRRTAHLEVPISPTLARRLRSRIATRFARVAVLPYSFQLPDGGADRLRGLLVEVLGDRAVIEIRTPLSYGADEPPLEAGDDLCRVVLFGLAQPPESEVHREFLDAVAAAGAPTIAIVDASGYRRRFGDDAEGRARVEERRRAWDRVLTGEGGAPATHLDLANEFDDASYARLSTAIGTARKNGSAR